MPLVQGDVIILDGPTEGISRELAYNYVGCRGTEQLSELLFCQLKGINGIELMVSLKPGVIEIPANTTLAFSFSGIQNPQSTKPSGAFTARI